MIYQPGSVLERILVQKRKEVEQRKKTISLEKLQSQITDVPPTRDFAAALRKHQAVALIAEVKKASPSRGILLKDFDHRALAQTYMTNGAAAISVLTDETFFQGSHRYLREIREMQQLPIPLLCKDFIVEPYQIYEARVAGADALLLIVAILDDQLLRELLSLTAALQMYALVEVHNEEELKRALAAGSQLIGVNNRDLHTFETDLETTERMAALLPTDSSRPIFVSESGIHHVADVERLRQWGVDAILVGEALVKAEDIASKVQELAQV